MRSRMSGRAAALENASFKRARTALGTAAGANMPCQPTTSKLMPDSTSVGSVRQRGQALGISDGERPQAPLLHKRRHRQYPDRWIGIDACMPTQLSTQRRLVTVEALSRLSALGGASDCNGSFPHLQRASHSVECYPGCSATQRRKRLSIISITRRGDVIRTSIW